VLIADEPTRGIDVGAKRAIYELITGLAAAGAAVLLISSETEEILGLAHRVLVMRGGRVTAELTGERMTESAILEAAFETADATPGTRAAGAGAAGAAA
jgi:simple sugar transport system ATP-binding protein/ribose transport system ATP-binding protein